MSMFSKLTDLALKALEKSGTTNQPKNVGQKDWRAIVRTAADTLTGDGQATGAPAGRRPASPETYRAQPHRSDSRVPSGEISNADRAAIARYDYLLETANPHQIEQMHREAFERLTPAQRDQIQQRIRTELPTEDHPRTSGADDLARTAARAEAGRPGFLRGMLARAGSNGSRPGGGIGRGVMVGGAAAGAGLLAGGVLTAVAGGAVASSLAGPLLEQASAMGIDFEALGNGLDLEDLTGGMGEFTANAGETVSGLGEQFNDVGSNFSVPGIDDLFGR
ncbi:hypothetical protein OIU93_20245 [Paeniglutamicibacter sp. ZC-3]|uniref:hypothetical protein n=1 Tax=Paeniglutamicibacter sp. ZC-3 TaxID=2986919 RepID=UPI0021F725A1|nr:hypothetical protein [Paeniglutamicibacter sp. ZC-3]MCV9996589.1 hypothetical protein [Paeniglutamicibacter sp. ZC-3]